MYQLTMCQIYVIDFDVINYLQWLLIVELVENYPTII